MTPVVFEVADKPSHPGHVVMPVMELLKVFTLLLCVIFGVVVVVVVVVVVIFFVTNR